MLKALSVGLSNAYFKSLGLGDLILGEILHGVDSGQEFRSLKRHFSQFPIYSIVGHQNAIQSALNYRKLRGKGIRVRKTIDCWIATFCIDRGFPLLHADRDFDPFEQHLSLKVLR